MLIAQALGEYGGMAVLAEGIRSGRIYVEELGREWGWMGLGIALAAAVAWKILTRVR
jgi:hypothetical protein